MSADLVKAYKAERNRAEAAEVRVAELEDALRVPRWQYRLFKRWFNEDTCTSRQIAAEAARQAGER